MRFKHIFLALGLVAAPLLAFGASSINPTVPATNAPMSSAPIRNNFLASYNDINNIESKFGSTISPSTPSTRQDWFDTTTSTAWNWKVYDGGQWVSIGTLNPTTHVWTAAVGGSVTSFSAGSTGLTPSSATAGAVTLAGILSGANGGTGVANTGKTITLGGNVSTSSTLSTTGAFSTGGAFSTSSTVSVTGALSTSADLSTTGAGATTLAFGASTQTYTFPTTTATLARTDAGQTFTGANTFTGTLTTNVTGGGIQCAQLSNTGVLSGTGASCASGLVVGSTTIASGSTGRVEYNNGGVLGEMTTTGSGTVLALATTPTFVTSITTPIVNGATTEVFQIGGVEAARFGSDKSFLIGTTTNGGWAGYSMEIKSTGVNGALSVWKTDVNGATIIARVDNTNSSFMDLRSGTTQVGSISTNGTSTTYATSSDARLKNNISDATDPGAIIDALRVRQWDWKSNGSHEDYGFVAQEEYVVAPFAVNQGDSSPSVITKQWSRDDAKLVPLLIREVQLLRARVAVLEARP